MKKTRNAMAIAVLAAVTLFGGSTLQKSKQPAAFVNPLDNIIEVSGPLNPNVERPYDATNLCGFHHQEALAAEREAHP